MKTSSLNLEPEFIALPNFAIEVFCEMALRTPRAQLAILQMQPTIAPKWRSLVQHWHPSVHGVRMGQSSTRYVSQFMQRVCKLSFEPIEAPCQQPDHTPFLSLGKMAVLDCLQCRFAYRYPLESDRRYVCSRPGWDPPTAVLCYPDTISETARRILTPETLSMAARPIAHLGFLVSDLVTVLLRVGSVYEGLLEKKALGDNSMLLPSTLRDYHCVSFTKEVGRRLLRQIPWALSMIDEWQEQDQWPLFVLQDDTAEAVTCRYEQRTDYCGLIARPVPDWVPLKVLQSRIRRRADDYEFLIYSLPDAARFKHLSVGETAQGTATRKLVSDLIEMHAEGVVRELRLFHRGLGHVPIVVIDKSWWIGCSRCDF